MPPNQELLEQFKTRYQNLLRETQKLLKQIRDNEATALKLIGAIETLEYLAPKEDKTEKKLLLWIRYAAPP